MSKLLLLAFVIVSLPSVVLSVGAEMGYSGQFKMENSIFKLRLDGRSTSTEELALWVFLLVFSSVNLVLSFVL